MNVSRVITPEERSAYESYLSRVFSATGKPKKITRLFKFSTGRWYAFYGKSLMAYGGQDSLNAMTAMFPKG